MSNVDQNSFSTPLLEICEKIHKTYLVRFDFENKVFKCNGELCIGNFIIDEYFVFITKSVIVFTQDHIGYNGLFQEAEGVYFVDQNKLIAKKETPGCHTTQRLQKVLTTLQNYILKYNKIYNNYINNSTQKDIWLLHEAKHIGHDILDEILRWDELYEKVSNKIKVLRESLFFSHEKIQKMFQEVESFDTEEDLFKNICVHNHMLYKARSMPKTFSNKLIKHAYIQSNTLESDTIVGIMLKEDKLYKNCLNSYEFYTQIINFLLKNNFKIKIFGYIQLRQKCTQHNSFIENNQLLGEKLISYYQANLNVSFYNPILIEEFIQHAANLTYYITCPGSLQHVIHLFAFNLKKGLVYGDTGVKYFNTHQKLMQYNSLPAEFIEYIDLDNNKINDITNTLSRDYNFKIKNLDKIDQFLEVFVNIT